MNILVLFAGSSAEFYSKGYSYPKYLTEVNGKPLVEYVINNLRCFAYSRLIFAVLQEDCERYHLDNVISLLVPDAKIVRVEKITKGAACTVLLAIEDINTDDPLLIMNGDQIIDTDLSECVESFQATSLDGGILTFDSVHPRWSYVRLDEHNLVIEAAEKRPISRHATAGTYYFKKGRDFVESAMAMIEKDAHYNGMFYVCPSYNEMILNHAKIGIFNIDRSKYLSVATPEGVANFIKYIAGREATAEL